MRVHGRLSFVSPRMDGYSNQFLGISGCITGLNHLKEVMRPHGNNLLKDFCKILSIYSVDLYQAYNICLSSVCCRDGHLIKQPFCFLFPFFFSLYTHFFIVRLKRYCHAYCMYHTPKFISTLPTPDCHPVTHCQFFYLSLCHNKGNHFELFIYFQYISPVATSFSVTHNH